MLAHRGFRIVMPGGGLGQDIFHHEGTKAPSPHFALGAFVVKNSALVPGPADEIGNTKTTKITKKGNLHQPHSCSSWSSCSKKAERFRAPPDF
jgi:hypothetical protein